MAGRRVALKAVDWLAFAERVPPNQRGMFNALKTRSDAIAAKLVSHQSQCLGFFFYFTFFMLLVLVFYKGDRVFVGCFRNQLTHNKILHVESVYLLYWEMLKVFLLCYPSILYRQVLSLHNLKFVHFINLFALFCWLESLLTLTLFLLSSFLISLYSRLSSLPEAPAAIDWSYYRSTVANSGMVDEFEKKVNLITHNYFMTQQRDAVSILKQQKCVVTLRFASTLFS